MIKNAKVDKTMKEIIQECESGDSIYTPQEEKEISLILYEGISKGENFQRIYDTKLKAAYPLPRGEGLVESHIRLRQLYADMVQKYKKAVSIDREHIFDETYTRLEEIYWNEYDKHDIEGQRKTLKEIKDLIKHALSERALDQANSNTDSTVEFHLDFGL